MAHSHRWFPDQIGRLTDPLITQIRHRLVDMSSAAQREDATLRWLALTAAGDEGMVMKPVVPGGASSQDRRCEAGTTCE
ncbi:hypothetical protein [Georgenia sp.]